MKNHKEKFSKIYDKYIEKIYRFVFVKVNSQEIAEDICSETFIRTWNVFQDENKAKIKNPRAFLYKIARNLIIDYYRQKSKDQVIPLEDVQFQLINHRIDLAQEAITRSDFHTIMQSLAGLKEDYQNVIIWHYLDEFSIAETAELLGRTKEATRVLLHRALQKLKNNVKLVLN
jgi:RNA polymerase sigma-70 factor (ECF subfamily)